MKTPLFFCKNYSFIDIITYVDYNDYSRKILLNQGKNKIFSVLIIYCGEKVGK